MCEGSTGGDRDGIRHFLGYGLSATASPRGAAFTNGVSVGATCLATYVQGYGQSPGGNYVIEFIFLCMTLAFAATEMARCLRQGSSIILQGTVGHTGFRHHTGYQIAGFRPSFCRVPSVIPGFDHHFAGFRHTGFRPSFCRVPSAIPGFVESVYYCIKKSYRNTAGPLQIRPQSLHSQVTLDLRLPALKSHRT